jgi:pimeloyl-ACP methyl ester carboxylesterase
LEDKGVEDKGVQLVIFGGYGLASVYLFRDLVTMLQERFPSFGISVIDIPGAGGHPWNMRAAEGNEIEGCISDTLLAVLEESNRDVIVVTFSTAGLFLRSALMKLQEGGFKLQRIIGVSFISLPLGVRRPENEVLAKVVNFIERYGPTRPIAHLGDFIWIKVSTRRPDRRTPPKLNNIPQTEWYPLRATSTIISQGLRVRSSSLLPENLSTVPQLVIHGTRDGKCPPGPVWILVDHFNATGQRLQKLELPHSGHAIPLGKDAALFEQEFVQWCELLLSCRTTERT